jgi:7-cyano-7-deazaguanine synthase in queuosine biosynthesis
VTVQWHIISQVGETDVFTPAIRSTEPRITATIGKAISQYPIRNRVTETLNEVGLVTTESAEDLLNFALSIFTADVRVPRSSTEDGWTRDLLLYLPVANPGVWTNALPTLTRMLSFLTGDRWEVQLRSRKARTRSRSHLRKPPQCVSLFSGGLDSFVGAVDLLESGSNAALVGQYGAGTTGSEQQRAHSAIETVYKGRTLPLWFYVQSFKGEGRESENTMRARSILFLALGTVVASAIGPKTSLFVPENGLISLNVPLTFSRMGSLSTRTTHSHFISLYRTFLAELGIDVPIETPYRFKTKGEMLIEAKNETVLRTGARETMSCAHPAAGRFQGLTPGKHCGYCVPCIIRRAAMRAVGLDSKDDYNVNVLTAKPEPGAVQGRDKRAFEMAIKRVQSQRPLELIAEVLHSGPLPPDEIESYADVYRRGLKEVESFLYAKRRSK